MRVRTACVCPVDAGDSDPVPDEHGLLDLFEQRTHDAEQLCGWWWAAPGGGRVAVMVDKGIDSHADVVGLGGDDLPEDVDAGGGDWSAWWIVIVLTGGCYDA